MTKPSSLTLEILAGYVAHFRELEAGHINTDIIPEFTPECDAVRFTIKRTGRLTLWYPFDQSDIDKAERDAIRYLVTFPSSSCMRH